MENFNKEEPQWLRFFIKPEILGSDRPLPVHLYKFLDNQFSPLNSDSDAVSINSKNCLYPFRDGSLWRLIGNQNIPPAYAGMIKCDYALPKHLADSLMSAIQQSHLFRQGDIFAIPRKSISASNSYFRSFTRDAIRATAEGDGGPEYALDCILSHLPGSTGSVTLLRTSVKSSTSIIILVDLDRVEIEEGLNREQTFAKAMVYRAGMLIYRAHDASLVRH